MMIKVKNIFFLLDRGMDQAGNYVNLWDYILEYENSIINKEAICYCIRNDVKIEDFDDEISKKLDLFEELNLKDRTKRFQRDRTRFWKSKEWIDFKTRIKSEKGGKCEWCGSRDRLTVCHKDGSAITYLDPDINRYYVFCSRCAFGLTVKKCRICHKELHDRNRDCCYSCSQKLKENKGIFHFLSQTS